MVKKPIQPALPPTNNLTPAPRSSFDTDEFFDMTQGQIKRFNERLTEEYQEALTNNLDDFCRGIKRAMRENPNRQIRPMVERELDRLLKQSQKNGGRIPEHLDSQFNGLDDIDEDHEKHLTKQDALDKKMLKKIEPMSESYISKLEGKRAELIEKRDEVAAEEIAREIDLTRSDAGHFQQILGCEIPDVGELNKRETSDKWDQQDE